MNKTSLPENIFKFVPILIFILGTFTVLYHLGTAGLFETSEGRYASVARAMLDSGDWITPVHNGLKHLTKPPMTYWAGAMGMQLFGINEFGARFFLSVSAGLTALGCFLIARALFDATTGLMASLILICSLFFQVQFRGLTTDPFLTMFETFMVFAFIRFIQTYEHRKNKRWELVFWFLAACAMLTKGPPGLLPLAGLIPAALWTDKKRHIKALFSSMHGWLIFLVFGLGWYLVLAIKTPGLLSYFLIDETFKRVASSSHQRSAPFYLFLVLLPVGIFPWTSFLVRGLKEAYLKQKKQFEFKLLFFWLIIPLAIFTLSKSKLPAYVLPLLIPLAIITAAAVSKVFSQAAEEFEKLKFHVRLNAALLILLGVGTAAYGFSGGIVSPVLVSSLSFIGIFWFFLGICLLIQSFIGNRLLAFALLCFAAPGFIFFTVPGIQGNEQLRVDKFLPSQWLLLKRIANLPPQQKIINIEDMIEGWYFYTGRDPITWNITRVTNFDQEKAKELVLHGFEELNKAVDTNTMLVLRSKDLPILTENLNYELKIVATEGTWLVVAPERRIRP